MKRLKDNFSEQAYKYCKYRPDYPDTLYQNIYQHMSVWENCWDCATGNGQAASILAERFEHVYATDISVNQLKSAIQKANIQYSIQRAEQSNFQDQMFDLVTVAQALHWFDFAAFYSEIRRVLKPTGILAVWGYGLFESTTEADALIHHFYSRLVGPYWDPERKHIEDRYASIAIPAFLETREINEQHFSSFKWSVTDILSYLSTWSSVQHYHKKHGTDPVFLIQDELLKLLGSKIVEIRFPLFLRIYKIKS